MESSYTGGRYFGESKRQTKTTILPQKEPDLQIVKKPSDDTIAATKQEEWTTSKKVVNHKTKQVETRVQRQIVMEDGKVIADSGPQVTTKTKEDHKKEESENTHHKNSGDVDTIPKGYAEVPGSSQVFSEKTETHNTLKEVKEENLQYHDESLKELSGYDIHRKALSAPNELITIDDNNISDLPKGKLIHYSSKGNRINDSEEIKEVSKVGRDGKIETETTRTHHHEEANDDELPEEDTDAAALPQASAETSRKVEYLKDYPDGNDRFSNAMQRKNLRAIEGRTDETHSKETTQWLDDHFGSDESDIVETGATRTGKVVNIEVKSDSRQSTLKSDKPKPGGYKTTATYYLGQSPSPGSTPVGREYTREMKSDFSQQSKRRDVRYERESPSYDHYISRSPRDTRYREDASVQASFSDSDEHDTSEVEIGKVYRGKEVKKQSKNESGSNTFYFGDERDTSFRHSPDYKNFKHIEDQILNTYNTIERESKLIGKTPLDYNSNQLNTSDLRTNGKSEKFEDFQSAYHFDEHKDRSWSEYPSFDDDWKKSGSREYLHYPIIENGSSRRDPLSRQRNSEDFFLLPPPETFSSSKIMSKGVDDFYRSQRTPSPPASGGTWTKSKGHRLSPVYRSSSPHQFPDFTPLMSLSEIKKIPGFSSHN